MVLPISPIWATPIQDIPNPRKTNGTWVSDVANILSAETESRINQRITQLEARNGSEVAVVTVPDISPLASPKAYATQLFNTWGIGKRGLDNGVLLLISVNERRLEIETGRGLTSRLSNAQVTQIIETKIKPEFKLRKFDQGTINGVEEITNRLEQIGVSSFDFAIVYLVIGGLGIALALGCIAWTVSKINSWCQLLPDRYLSSNPLVFQVRVPQLKQVANRPILMLALGVSAIATGASAFLLSDSANSITSVSINLDQHFGDLICISAAIALISMPMWFGITYYWLAKLARALQQTIPSQLWKQWGKILVRNLFLLLVIQCSLLLVVIILISPSVAALLPSDILFMVSGLLLGMGYQLFLVHVVNQLSLDEKSEKSAREQFFCATCSNVTQRLDEALGGTYLTKPEKLAIELGNATYALYICDRCHPETKRDRKHMHCQPNILKSDSLCTKCQYPTVIGASLKKSRKPKKFPKQGSKDAVSILQCQNCFHEQPVYPYVAPSYSSNSFYESSSDHSSSSSSYDSSYSDYGSSSSSSDFGGGSSDGGGAGSDW
ncbi:MULTISPECIES: TPM domain-containing protein [Pseudanabaena]|uniref:TPM domain-containing protein n=1 Tax=Pseudanabaena catenata USMAC16 TaxID=1855837 RepID=A0A9X4RJQ7_9CYAN|nr:MULTISPECIES: TPM domain-containing protein [Pseudanabaena]MDG3497323.1 TPM domain-containing protein [Pseudanabaena catenata USMAC16]